MKAWLAVLLFTVLLGCSGADIKPLKSQQFITSYIKQCDTPKHYRKSLLMIDWQQASHSDDAPSPVLVKRYIEGLRAAISPSNIQIYTDYNAKLIGYDRADTDYPSLSEQVVNLARKARVQYVLHGRMLVNDQALSSLATMADVFDFRLLGSVHRNVEMELSLYDGVSGARVAYSTFQLNTEAERLHQRSVYDISQLTLQDMFGDDIDFMLASQAGFVQGTMKCLPLQAQVLRKERETIIVDVGSYHGVQVGDRFKIARRQDWGKYRSLDTGIQFGNYNMVEIIQVGIDTSQAKVVEEAIQDVSQQDLIVSSH